MDRHILWSKLSSLGISGKMLPALQSLYKNVQCCVRVNGLTTEFFNVDVGLKQGCLLSSVLFNLFINDFISFAKSLDIGLPVGDSKICILVYADDIVLLTQNETEMQTLLDALHAWCATCKMSVNLEKSNILHFRPPSVEATKHIFVFGENNIAIVDRYKYLGLVLTDLLDYNVTAKIRSTVCGSCIGSAHC